MATEVERDAVDAIVEQWEQIRPELDVTPLEIVGRLSRLSRIIDRRLAENFARFGIEAWMYDVLATLRRAGDPPSASPSELTARTMVTTGAMTNRIDRLAERGLVRRTHDPDDRRRITVTLTADGIELVDRVAADHYELERRLLGALPGDEQQGLATTLRSLLLSLGDHAGPSSAR